MYVPTYFNSPDLPFTQPSAGKQLTTALSKNVMIAHFYNQGTDNVINHVMTPSSLT